VCDRWNTAQLQAHLVQQGPAGPAFLASRRAYESYFYQITGFFIVEAHVWHTTQNLISPSTVREHNLSFARSI
jgi:hypothetical protein